MNERSVIIDGQEVELKTVQQVSRLPRSVENTAHSIETNFLNTAGLLFQTAEKLEKRAADLREKAAWLRENHNLAATLREAVSAERDYFDEVKSLALVEVGIRTIRDGNDV